MRWEDERYVRVYTRNTPEWISLSWEARTVFWALLREVDRAGILDLGRAGMRGLAAVLRCPLDVVERGVPELVADGSLTLTGSILLIPNFIEAQEATQTDKARKRASRERARDLARAETITGHHVTPRDDLSADQSDSGQTVTKPDEVSGIGSQVGDSVTLCCAVPSRTDPPNPPGGREAALEDPRDLDGPSIDALRVAYAKGITAATANPYVPPGGRAEALALDKIAEVHGAAENKPVSDVLAWLSLTAEQYATAVKSAKAERFHPGLTPARCLSWLNDGRPDLGERPGKSNGRPPPDPPPNLAATLPITRAPSRPNPEYVPPPVAANGGSK